MKRALVLFIMLLAVPAIVSANPILPDYQKDGIMVDNLTCDSEKTTVTAWYSKSQENVWRLVVVETGSGNIFYKFLTPRGDFFGMKAKESTEIQWRGMQEVNAALETAAPNFYNLVFGGKTDCK